MPCYANKCESCQHRFEDVRPMSAPMPKCPRCGGPTGIDWQRQGTPNVPAHDLHGTRSECQDVMMQAGEVGEARRLFGKAGNAIQPDGSVRFNHKSEAKAYYAKERELRARFAQQKAEGTLKPRKKPEGPVEVLRRGKR